MLSRSNAGAPARQVTVAPELGALTAPECTCEIFISLVKRKTVSIGNFQNHRCRSRFGTQTTIRFHSWDTVGMTCGGGNALH